MRLRALRSFLLPLFFAIAPTLPPASAQSPRDVELSAMNRRVEELYQAGKYSEAIPLAERYMAATGARYTEATPEYAAALNNLGRLLLATNRFAEAELLYRRALAINEKSLGPDHPNVATGLNYLAWLLQNTNRLAEAELLYRRALAIDEQSLGPDHTNVARDLNNLAQLLRATNHLSEAEPLLRRALAILEKSLGPDHPNVAAALSNLAELFQNTNRLAQAELLYRRALAIDEKSLGPGHPTVAIRLNNLAQLLLTTNGLSEAEPLMRRALAIDEQSLGPDHPYVATALNNLAQLLQATNRFAEAELLMRRALAIDEKSLGPDHPNVAFRLNNLAQLLQAMNQLVEAEPLMRWALAIVQKSFGPDHPSVATDLDNLARLLQATNRHSEAEPLMRSALAIDEKSYGPDHPDVARDLNNLAALLQDTNRLSEAEPLYKRALAIWENSLGLDHPKVAAALNNLARLSEEQGHWEEAVALYRKAKPIMTGANIDSDPDRGRPGKAVITQNTGGLRAYAQALYHAGPSNAANLDESFEAAQWVLQNDAADALSAMAARFGRGGEELGKLVREQQDLVSARQAAYRNLDVAAGNADTKAAEVSRAALMRIEGALAEKEAALRETFPDYAELANPKPLSLADAQRLLGEQDVLVLFLDLRQYRRVPEETIVFVLTKKEARWTSLALGTSTLRERVTVLRCGLDSSNWRFGEKSGEVCKGLLGTEVTEVQVPPFDAAAAHALYRDLFGGIEDLIQGERLLIVPSGALTQLPFEVLVTEKPDAALPRFEAYKTAAWLGQRQAITILPSVGSLKALSIAKASTAPEPFAGFGNPLLTGLDGTDKSAWVKQDCGRTAPPKQSRVASLAVSIASLFRGGAVDVEDLRRQPPLPETADELCSVGRALGVTEAGLSKAVYLGEQATVSRVKALSNSGALVRARVVHFATHGLLAGETAMFAKNKAEPALLLTPPLAGKASGEDNGLLTASEVAQLNLNADWVVMSACNTAAGSSDGAEALSGLARAFFYAGARALLVSHWYVDSEAAVAITTGAVNAMKAEPKIGRAEALRRSISALIAKGGRFAHPSNWAPFVLVGNGEQ
jgi:CHAT domain-containing protein/tetratricopeptide (TPR) repeat protein